MGSMARPVWVSLTITFVRYRAPPYGARSRAFGVYTSLARAAASPRHSRATPIVNSGTTNTSSVA